MRFFIGQISTAAAGTQPVLPFGRPGTLTRYQRGLPFVLLLTAESASTYCGR